MEVITEYDFEVKRRSLQKQCSLVKLIFKDLCKYLCQPDQSFNQATCFCPDFLLKMEACNRFKVYLPLTLGNEDVLYIHNHSPYCVLLQNIGRVSEFMKCFINAEGFLSSDGVKTLLNIHLAKAFDVYVQSDDYKRSQKERRFSGLLLSYTNVLQVKSEYGVINIEILPVMKVPVSLRSWFLRDYTCSPLYFVARYSIPEESSSPEHLWNLLFWDQEREVERKHQRLFLKTLVFVEKFRLRAIQRDVILAALLALDSKGNGLSKSLFGVLSFIKSALSSRCVYKSFLREKVNMIQFENEVEITKACNTIQRYLRFLRSYYSN